MYNLFCPNVMFRPYSFLGSAANRLCTGPLTAIIWHLHTLPWAPKCLADRLECAHVDKSVLKHAVHCTYRRRKVMLLTLRLAHLCENALIAPACLNELGHPGSSGQCWPHRFCQTLWRCRSYSDVMAPSWFESSQKLYRKVTQHIISQMILPKLSKSHLSKWSYFP